MIRSAIELRQDLTAYKTPLQRPDGNTVDKVREYFEDSPYIQDLVEGYYIGGGIEYLHGKNWGYRANIRHYDFAHMELNWTPKNSSTKAQYKYEDTLTQVEIGLVYYLRKK